MCVEATVEALLLGSQVARGRVAGSHLHGLDVHEPKITHDLLLLLRLFQSGPRLVQHKHLSIEETEPVRWRSTAVKTRDRSFHKALYTSR